MKLSKKVQALAPSATMAISARSKELKRQGAYVLDFGLGEPDFHTPSHIIDATIDALKQGKTKYCPATGSVELKQAVIGYYERKHELKYSKSEVIINIGAKGSLYTLFQAMLDDGDEVILPAPYWVSYYAHISLAGGVPKVIETHEDHNYKVTAEDVEKMISSKTAAIIINSPSNPSGMLYTKDELKEIAELCVSRGVYIVYDEVYENMVYDGEHVCIATLSEKVREYSILVNAVSKSYSMTGYRIGYTLGNEELINAMSKIQSHATSNPVTFAMEGAVEALNGSQAVVADMRAKLKQRRDYFHEKINEIDGIVCRKPDGAFYLFPTIKDLLGREIRGEVYNTDVEFCRGLLEKENIACVPGSAFGCPGHIRLSYVTSMETIEAALYRLNEWLAG